MPRPPFRVKRYTHGKYKFLVRWKVLGKWRRRYFETQDEAITFASQQNARAQHGNGDASSQPNGAPDETGLTSSRLAERPPPPTRPASARDFSRLLSPAYLGPRIERYIGDSWCMHLPFAYDLMRELAPTVFVELGVKQGESYFAFCQAAAENKINVRCYGVDSWRGDIQTGELDPKVQAEAEMYNCRYSSFSELKPMLFVEALKDFPDASIDLLHIDGTHTYADVKTDFESWLPKLSPKGIILFHDVILRDHGFGVWKLWDEITREHDSFLFEFGCGLGVWKKEPVTTSDSLFIRRLFSANEADVQDINAFYAQAAVALSLWHTLQKQSEGESQIARLRTEVEERSNQVAHFQHEIEEKAKHVGLLQSELKEKSDQVVHFQSEAEEKIKHADRLQSELKEKSDQATQFQSELGEKSSQIALFRRESEQRSQLLEGLRIQLETESDRLARTRDELLDARWEALTLRGTLLRKTNAAEAPSSRVPELENRVETTTLERDHLRTMLMSLQNDLEREKIVAQAKQTQVAATPPVLEDIARISNPSLLWRIARGLGILRFRQPGAPRTASERRTIAQELKGELRMIQKDLSVETITPEDATLSIKRLLELRTKTREILESLQLRTLFTVKEPTSNLQPCAPSPAKNHSNETPAAFLFDAAWYLRQNPDVAASHVNPLEHYLKWGVQEGRNPNPLFDTQWYLAENSDVADAGLSPIEHYYAWGAKEGRDPNPLFSTNWYLEANPDIRAAGINPLQHYLETGASEGRDPHPLFSSKWYREQEPVIDGRSVNPLQHYLLHGASEARSPHPMFDSESYRTTYLSNSNERHNPLVHYLTIGWRLGYQPNRQFDPCLYLHVHPDVAEAGIEPFTHYILSGKSEGRISSADEISFKAHKPDFEVPREPALPPEGTGTDVKAIAFYLPQFHRIPENDAWWGEGFTEWSNVRRGHPNFDGHYQPHVPSLLGYYDLSEQSVLEKQTQLARQAGIYGFCYHYYWFGGRVLLDLPVRRIVETGKPDFPFCICWANENWTRRWDGKESEILIAQRYSPDDDLAFIRKIEPVLRLKNYIRVEGKPMLLVYRPSLLPDATATLERWRNYARKVGLGDLHLVIVYSFSEQRSAEFYGFDAAVQFPPHMQATPITPGIPGRSPDFTGFIYDYTEVRRYALEQFASASAQTKLYPGVMPSWDNTARQRTRSTIWVNSSPEAYYEWLAEASRLVRAKSSQSDGLVFINAWNEWAEGCHLEPDERYGYAWLNATSLALRQGSIAAPKSAGLASHPVAPPEVPVLVRPLSGLVKLAVSVLLYHREDILVAFVTKLLPQLKVAAERDDLSCELFLSFNYEPSSEALAGLRQLIGQLLPGNTSCVHIIENRFNLGFGAGHNAIFEKTESDVIIILNSDLHIEDDEWLVKFADRFRSSDTAILGLAGNASRLREDGCGVPVTEAGAAFDFVDGSVLAIRSDLATQFGLFSPSFDYFYFEDVDLNLRYRQMGLRIETLDLPCLHERSSSTKLLPKFAVESVLNKNRARFFERWGKYLTTRTLTNRLALRFREADRQLQCASLPAILGLLAEHPTAVLDLWGVHEQLVPLFQHPRIRLIPWWQTPRPEDYLRWYELSLDATNTAPWAVKIAEQILVDPAFQAARLHLESLVRRDALEGEHTNRAVVYLARPQILFEGKQPETDSLLAAHEPLLQRGFAIQYHSEYGLMEVPAVPQSERQNWRYVARSTGLELLTDLAVADVLVTSDGWAAELGQLLNKKTLIWLGATSAGAVIWNADRTQPFSDPSLSCLGCHERFGQTSRNVCLRGDEACLRSGLTETFIQTVEKFLDGERVATPGPQVSSANACMSRLRLSDQEQLEAWPQSSAGSVLVLTPVNPVLDPAVLRRARELAERAIGGMRGCRIVYDNTGEAPPRGSTFPQRLAAMTPLRQAMIDRHLRDEKWIFWVDADLVEYPANLLEELISRAEGGIAAPLVLMEGDLSEPAAPAGFGPGRFYDIAGFIESGRWARFTQPYFDQPGPVYRLDSVGCCYLVNADLYRWGAKHELDYASKAFIAENRVWPDDAIEQNQTGPANSFTDHYSVCEFARKTGLPVQAFANLIAYHQKP